MEIKKLNRVSWIGNVDRGKIKDLDIGKLLADYRKSLDPSRLILNNTFPILIFQSVAALTLKYRDCSSVMIQFKCEDSGRHILWYRNNVLVATDNFTNNYNRSFSVPSGNNYTYSVSELLSHFQSMFFNSRK